MALKACRECGHQVSTEARTCPQCGVTDPTASKIVAKKGCAGGCLTVIGIVVLLSIFGNLSEKSRTSSSNTENAVATNDCVSDWRKCSDNSDLVDHWSGWFKISSACKDAAESRSKYGTPEWPWFSFSTYRGGRNYPSTGIVTVSEDRAKFSNGFGAMVKIDIICTYDLNKMEILNVNIIEQ